LKSAVKRTWPCSVFIGLGDRVGDTDELDGHAPRFHLVARFHAHDVRILEVGPLLELRPHQRLGERCAVDRHVKLWQDIAQRTDVVLVGVGEEDSPHPRLVLDQVADVGDHDVDAVVLLVRKAQAEVDDHDVVALFDHRAVLSDLTGPAERDDTNEAHRRSAYQSGLPRPGRA
jgi:hypothetical protein